jgi:hypothetical protein
VRWCALEFSEEVSARSPVRIAADGSTSKAMHARTNVFTVIGRPASTCQPSWRKQATDHDGRRMCR